MDEFPVQYLTTIKQALSKNRAKEQQKDDIIQQCYLELLQNQQEIQNAEEPEEKVKEICQSVASYMVQAERGSRRKHDSLSDPRAQHKADKIRIPKTLLVDEPLYQAISSLENLSEYRVIYSIYAEGKTEEETASDLGLSRQNVRSLKKRGVNNLKKYFEVSDGGN